MKKRKKLLAFLLCMTTVMTALPLQAYAMGAEATRGDTERILYENGFETLPEELSGSEGWNLEELKDGTYALLGTSAAGSGLLAQFTDGVELPEQYTVVVDMALVEGVSDSGYSAGLTVQHEDSNNFYHFRLDNGVGKSAQFYQWADGKAKMLADKKGITLEDGEAYRLRLTVDGSTITGYVDGQQMVSYEGEAAGGNPGFRVYNAATLFDNLIVYEGVVLPPENDTADDLVFADGESVVWNNEETDSYREISGTWSDVAGCGWDGSASRSAEEGSVVFSKYSPGTGNYNVEWYVPAVDGAEADVTVQTLNGIWKYKLPANAEIGWHKLGIVSGTENTAFTITVDSKGKMYADAVRLTETKDKADEEYSPTEGGSDAVAVLVNQIGYDNGTSMRATIPNAENGTKFQVSNTSTNEVVYEGEVQNQIADFTGQVTTDEDTDFYITCAGAQSYDFTIGDNLIYRRSVENALAFMSEVRSDTFCVGQNSIAWRDSHQFSFELNGLVLQYMANPSLYDNMDYQIYKVDTCEYEELRVQDEPALIWLIQFAAQRYYDWGAVRGRDLHGLTKEQLAYYLYIYPEISEFVDEETYKAIRDYTISVWGNNRVSGDCQWYPVSGTNHDLYALQDIFGGLKGSQPPGHSIVPNLLMYEVALRDGLGSEVADRFFDAAYLNCEYLVSSDFDLNDPFYNKGQRMSEYITIPALAYFLEMYPNQAPAGVKETIQEWADVTIARSDNMWDIRMAVSMAAGDGKYYFHNPKLSDKKLEKDYWTGAAYANDDAQADYLAGGAPKNEPGNQAGLQAITYAAARVLGNTETSSRLKELGVAAIDDLYGRNPSGRAAFYHFTRDFEGGDLGWYKQYAGGAGVLEGHTAVMDANAPEKCYPYNPEAYNTGYTEGWTAYNTAWNASLAYLAADGVELNVSTDSGNKGTDITITLTAPNNIDNSIQENGEVIVTTSTGESTAVTVTEDGTNSQTFTGIYTLPNVPYVTVSYGSGLFERTCEVQVADFEGVPVTSITLEKEAFSMAAGEKMQLQVSVAPEEASDKRVTYTSSNPDVVTVTNDGIVKAVSVGEATITAESVSTSGVSDTCKIIVGEAAPSGLVVEAPDTISVFGEAAKIHVTGVVYSDGRIDMKNLPVSISYVSEDENIAKVDSDGNVIPVNAGEVTITAKASIDGREVTGSAEVVVVAEVTYDFLELYRDGKYMTDEGASVTIAAKTNDSLTASYGSDRVKLTGGTTKNKVSFQLEHLVPGEYQITLFTKFMGGTWAYGVWSLEMDGVTLIENMDFDNEEKNGTYHNVDLGTITLNDEELHVFTFVSEDGGSVVPISVTITKENVENNADIEAAQKVDQMIEEIGEVTLESGDAIQKAREAYDALTDKQKALVTMIEVLEAAEELYQKLQEEAIADSKKTLEYFLNSAKEHVANGDTNDCVQSVKDLFAEAITEGEEVMADENATKEEVLDAAKKLMLAIQGLDMKVGNKTDLEMAVELGALVDLTKYVEQGQKEFIDSLNTAKAVLENGNAMQKEIDSAWEALVKAIDALRLKANKEALEELLDEVKEMNLYEYTEESVKNLKEALTAAEKILADDSLSEDDQQIVDEAVKLLNTAKAGLIPKENGSGEEKPPVDPDSSETPKNDEDKAVVTGDTETVWMWMVIMFMTVGCGLIVLYKNRRKEEL